MAAISITQARCRVIEDIHWPHQKTEAFHLGFLINKIYLSSSLPNLYIKYSSLAINI